MQVYVKRAKIFMDDSGGSHLRCTLAKQEGPQPAPDWIRNAPGFKEGIKDGSIIDLTPAAPVKAKKHKAEEVEDEDEISDDEPTDTEDVVDTEEELQHKVNKAETKSRKPKGVVTASASVIKK